MPPFISLLTSLFLLAVSLAALLALLFPCPFPVSLTPFSTCLVCNPPPLFSRGSLLQLWKTVNFSSSFVGMWPAPLAAVPTGWLPGPLGKGGPGLLSVGQAAVSATAFDGTSLWSTRLDYIPPYGVAYVGDFAVAAQVGVGVLVVCWLCAGKGIRLGSYVEVGSRKGCACVLVVFSFSL